MAKSTKIDVPKLEEKVALTSLLLPERVLGDNVGTSFYDKLLIAAGLRSAAGLKTNASAIKREWLRCLEANRLPVDLVQAWCRIYVGLTPELLILPIDEFKESLRPVIRAFDRARDAAEYYARNRPELAAIARDLYPNSHDKDLPILTKPGWILRQPILLTAEIDRRILSWRPIQREFPAALVPGLGLPFHELKKRLDPTLRLWDGNNYQIVQVDTGKKEPPRLHFAPGRYLEFFNDSELRGLELARGVLDARASGSRLSFEQLPFRGSPEVAFDFNGRPTCVGTVTLVIVKNYSAPGVNRHDAFMYHKRGMKVAEGQNLLHVAPAGNFEPYAEDDGYHARDFSIVSNVLREFAEELLGKENFSSKKNRGQDFRTDPALKPYLHALETGRARLYFLGFGLEPITLKGEALTVLVLDAATLPTEGLERFKENYEGTLRTHILSREELGKFGRRKDMYPSGAACLRLLESEAAYRTVVDGG